MVSKYRYQPNEGIPSLDEAWWSALLAEEERFAWQASDRFAAYPVPEDKNSKPQPQGRRGAVDWKYVKRLFERDETICLPVTGHNRGGLLVEGKGVHGFVPLSHLVDLNFKENEAEREQLLDGYTGQTLCLKVIECDPERGRVVFSERAAAAGAGRRNQLFEALKIGQCVSGVVTNVTDFGIFVDLGGVEGLIHVSELSWGRVRHPSDAAVIGKEVEALVINVDKDRARVALSMKRLRPNPWENAARRYYPGQVIEAAITSVVPFGAFARLEEGLDGLIHVSEMGLGGANPDPRELLHEGQVVRVRVLHVDVQKQRLGLSLIEEG